MSNAAMKKRLEKIEKAVRGRKHVRLDEAALAEVAIESGATDNRLALYFGVDPKTMTANYSKLLAQKRAERKIAIARAQYRRALKGDSTLLIWLGKVELEQTDKSQVEHTGEISAVVKFIMPRPGDKVECPKK
ncbi:MAG: hypothetical protein WC130_11710 [Kiritimatiellia bacterium]